MINNHKRVLKIFQKTATTVSLKVVLIHEINSSTTLERFL